MTSDRDEPPEATIGMWAAVASGPDCDEHVIERDGTPLGQAPSSGAADNSGTTSEPCPFVVETGLCGRVATDHSPTMQEWAHPGSPVGLHRAGSVLTGAPR